MKLAKSELIGLDGESVLRSAVASRHDEPGQPSERLLDLVEAVIPLARKVSLDDVSELIVSGPKWPAIWPGEHYKLLAAIVGVLQPLHVIEIGTYQGIGTLTLLENLPQAGVVSTFDIVPWDSVENSVLRETNFGKRLRQFTEDITTDGGWARHIELFRTADLIFVDTAHTGEQERLILGRLEETDFESGPIVVFDDIRMHAMLQFWRDITRPKLDVTSIGHWSGTGLVDFS
jgi:predicted O-methyltransferase YrrM